MLGTGIIKGMVETARNFVGSYHDPERLTTVQYPEQKLAPKENGRNFRENEIWREIVDRRTGNTVGEEMLVTNFSEVKYDLDESQFAAESLEHCRVRV